jgi:ribosome-associated protein
MPPLRDLVVSPRRVLPARLLRARFSRSSGPGGQNVNKLATKVDLRLDLEAARAILGEPAVRRVREKLAARLDAEGRPRVVADRHRERARNLEAALRRMEELLREALARPRARKPTRPSGAGRERRLADKRLRSRLKRQRRSHGPGGDAGDVTS